MNTFLAYLKTFPVERVILKLCLFAICLLIVKLILFFFDQFFKRSKIDTLVYKALRIVLKVFLLFTAVIILLSSIGISVSSLVAALSVIGVAFSLAIQGFLSNVFGGIEIISNHPFKIGDYVEAGGEAGTVREVGLFYTKLDTPDKKLVQIPNSKIANESIINYSNAHNRRLEFIFSLSYDHPVEKVQEIVLQMLKEHPMVLSDADLLPAVHVKEFRDSHICYTARAWCENANYWTVYFDIMDALKPTLEKNNIGFGYPHLNVHMIER